MNSPSEFMQKDIHPEEAPKKVLPDSYGVELTPSPYPKIGDHVYCKRRGYTHHGVYIGEDQVVHYSGLHHSFRSGPIVLTTLDGFLEDSSLLIKHYSIQKFTPEEIKNRALSRLGENLYHPLFNNCEHFSEWCIMKNNRSKQVDLYSTIGAGLLGYLISRGGSKLATLIRHLYKNHKNK